VEYYRFLFVAKLRLSDATPPGIIVIGFRLLFLRRGCNNKKIVVQFVNALLLLSQIVADLKLTTTINVVMQKFLAENVYVGFSVLDATFFWGLLNLLIFQHY
jgi:hypothetical protein